MEEMGEERKKHLLDIFLKILWTSLTILVVLGALVPMTIFLGWWKFILLCLLGLVAGISITTGVLTSPKDRALIALLLGVFVLPGLAIYLGSVAVRSRTAFNTYSASLIPFVAYALSTLVSGLVVGKIWQKRPVRKKEGVPAKEEAKVGEEAKAETGVRMP